MSEDIYVVEKVALWTVHSSKANQPEMRGWARSRSEAESLERALRARDREPADEYWVEQMTRHDYGVYRAMGLLPDGV
jgi:hypothetical protein